MYLILKNEVIVLKNIPTHFFFKLNWSLFTLIQNDLKIRYDNFICNIMYNYDNGYSFSNYYYKMIQIVHFLDINLIKINS